MSSPHTIYVSSGDVELRARLWRWCGKFLIGVGGLDALDDPSSSKSSATEKLRAEIAPYAEVIHIVGKRFGPAPADVGARGVRRSCAQIEYDLALALGKPLHVVLLGDDFPSAFNQPDEWSILQDRHRQTVAAGPHPVTTINNLRELKELIVSHVLRISPLPVRDDRVRQRAVIPDAASIAPDSAPLEPPPSLSTGKLDAVSSVAGILPEATPPRQSFPVENVVFTAYRPRTIRPGQWEKLLFFAHLDEKPAWMDEDERTPIEEVEAQAAGILGRRLDQYSRHSGDSRFPVPRDGEITLAPEMAGVEFDPPRRSFFWREGVTVQGETFRLRAAPALEGQIARGRITVFLGALILAEIGLAIRVGGGSATETGTRRATAAPFRKIFASYSHRDVEVVETLERHARTLGDEYLRDWMHLRSGEQWDARLLSLVEQADVFQLFWSHHSAGSPFVEREWRHALRLGREAFVRPTYWELPMPPPPPDLAGIHFHRLTAALPPTVAPPPPAAPIQSEAPAVFASPAAPAAPRPPVADRRKKTVRIDVPAISARPPAQATVRIDPVPPPATPALHRPSRQAGCLSSWLLFVLFFVALAAGYWFLQHLR